MSASTDTDAPHSRAARSPQPWWRWAAVALAALGLWFSFDLTALSLGAAASNPLIQSQCGGAAAGGGAFDCRSVLNTPWGSIALSQSAGSPRIPTAALGMGYFGFVGLWYLFVGVASGRRWAWQLVIGAVVTLGALQSVHLISVMATVLQRWCLGCVLAHAANAGLVLLTLCALLRRDRTAPEHAAPSPALAISTLCAGSMFFLLTVTVSILLVMGSTTGQLAKAYQSVINDPAFARWQYERQPRVDIPLPSEADRRQPESAAHTAVVFADFQCPRCRGAHEIIERARERHPGRLRVIYRHFPLDGSCNPSDYPTRHPYACQAAAAAEAAYATGGSGALERMRALLYERQNQLARAEYDDWAVELGLDAAAFSSALESDLVQSRIRRDVELGKKLGVRAVPVIFLDGRRLDYWMLPETWDALIGDQDRAD